MSIKYLIFFLSFLFFSNSNAFSQKDITTWSKQLFEIIRDEDTTKFKECYVNQEDLKEYFQKEGIDSSYIEEAYWEHVGSATYIQKELTRTIKFLNEKGFQLNHAQIDSVDIEEQLSNDGSIWHYDILLNIESADKELSIRLKKVVLLERGFVIMCGLDIKL